MLWHCATHVYNQHLMTDAEFRVGLLASGDRQSGEGGGTAERIARDALEGKVAFNIGVVVCNNPEGTVGVWDKFAKLNEEFGLRGDNKFEVVNIGPGPHPDGKLQRGQTLSESTAICRLFEERSIDFGAMAGYLRILTGEYLKTWCWQPEYAGDPLLSYRHGLYHPSARTSNNHPSILPFTRDTHGPGAHSLAMDLYRAGKIRHTAMTWHLASEKIDEGPTIHEIPVEIKPVDDDETLGNRVQDTEKEKSAEVIWNHLIFKAEHLRANS